MTTVMTGGKPTQITSKDIMEHICATIDTMGKTPQGFSGKYVGAHSIWSSFAMQMYLQSDMIYTLMLQGRWISDA